MTSYPQSPAVRLTDGTVNIFNLLYNERNATEILNGADKPFYKILSITVPEPSKPQVVIQYDRHSQVHELTVMTTAFYFLHYQRRLERSLDYQVKLIDSFHWAVHSTKDPKKSPQLVTLVEGKLNCSCPDHRNQHALLEHPWLWSFIGRQVQCKHTQAVYLELNGLTPTVLVDAAEPPPEYQCITKEPLEKFDQEGND